MAVCPMTDVDASAAARTAGSSDGRMVMAERPACCGSEDSRSAIAKPAARSLALCVGLLCAALAAGAGHARALGLTIAAGIVVPVSGLALAQAYGGGAQYFAMWVVADALDAVSRA